MIQLILKVASRCNLNCTYCYVYNKGDTTWRRRPPLMSDTVFDAAIRCAEEHCRSVGDRSLSISFHGGEPTLVGVSRFRAWCAAARERLSGIEVSLSIQTNGTLLGEEWIRAFRDHNVGVGVSVDGPPDVHDRHRVDHAGRGSHAAMARGLGLLRAAGVQHGVLCVIPLGQDPLRVHRHLVDLGAPVVTYLWPDFTHDTIGPVREEFGPTPCADFLIPVFDAWAASPDEIQVRDLENISRVVLGGRSRIETIGNPAPHYFFVEADGSIEGLDALRVCENGISDTHLDVLTSDFAAVRRAGGLHALSVFEGMPLPQACHGCPEALTCAGGHLPHRFSAVRRFDNPSVWCADLLKVFAHVRARLDVTVEETLEHRRRYQSLRAAPPVCALATTPEHQTTRS